MRIPVSLPRSGDTREGGAAAVEFAILTPLIFGIIFGMFTLGLAWNTKQTLTYAAREGARYGATHAVEADINDWLSDVVAHTQDASGLDFSTGEDAAICVAYISKDEEARSVTGDPPISDETPDEWCYQDHREDEARVQVSVSRTSQIVVVIPPKPVFDVGMLSRSSARHEVANVGGS